MGISFFIGSLRGDYILSGISEYSSALISIIYGQFFPETLLKQAPF